MQESRCAALTRGCREGWETGKRVQAAPSLRAQVPSCLQPQLRSRREAKSWLKTRGCEQGQARHKLVGSRIWWPAWSRAERKQLGVEAALCVQRPGLEMGVSRER